MTARDILDAKGRDIFSISEDASVSAAVAELARKKIGLLIVRNLAGAIIGVISERDIIHKCIYRKGDPADVKVGDIMTPKEEIVVAAEEDDIQTLMNTMTEKRIRHLPVFRQRELSGIVSIGDIVKIMLEIKDYEIKTLKDYITGKYPG